MKNMDKHENKNKELHVSPLEEQTVQDWLSKKK